jgi:hypothetical protein
VVIKLQAAPVMKTMPSDQIEKSIFVIRDHKVILDSDLARIYGVTTKRLNEQVKRNLRRFPEDFMFQLTETEGEILRSQIATSRLDWGGRRFLPYVFTEHGAVMLASVLNSEVAVQASVQVVRAFISLRRLLSSHSELARKVALLERKYDGQFKSVFEAIRQLITPIEVARRRIGIKAND